MLINVPFDIYPSCHAPFCHGDSAPVYHHGDLRPRGVCPRGVRPRGDLVAWQQPNKPDPAGKRLKQPSY